MDELLDQFMEGHINCGYGDILDQLAAEEFADEYLEDEQWGESLAQQTLEECQQADEYLAN